MGGGPEDVLEELVPLPPPQLESMSDSTEADKKTAMLCGCFFVNFIPIMAMASLLSTHVGSLARS
jgi:hypothetical protein